MNREQEAQTSLAHEVEKAEILAGLRHALDVQYRRICQAARADWERLFKDDPSDACVTVRLQADSSTAIRGSGFLKSRRQPETKSETKDSLPRFAH